MSTNTRAARDKLKKSLALREQLAAQLMEEAREMLENVSDDDITATMPEIDEIELANMREAAKNRERSVYILNEKIRDWILDCMARFVSNEKIMLAAATVWKLRIPVSVLHYMRHCPRYAKDIAIKRRRLLSDCSAVPLAHPQVRMKIRQKLFEKAPQYAKSPDAAIRQMARLVEDSRKETEKKEAPVFAKNISVQVATVIAGLGNYLRKTMEQTHQLDRGIDPDIGEGQVWSGRPCIEGQVEKKNEENARQDGQ